MATTKKTAAAPAAEKIEKKVAPKKRAPKTEESVSPTATEVVTSAPIVEEKAVRVSEPVVAVNMENVPKSIGGKFIYAKGRRKSAVAKVKMWLEGKGEIRVNGKKAAEYFPLEELRESLVTPLKAVGMESRVTIEIIAAGGGMRGQAEASRLGISRALIALVPEFRKTLKKMGLLMRDPREKERKKPGKKRARKGSQWAKR